MEETQEGAGLSRRSLLKRGALVGGAMVWATPVVQSIGSSAMAATGSACVGTLTVITGGQCYKVADVQYSPSCCDCVTHTGSCSDAVFFATCLGSATVVGTYPPNTPC